MNKVLLWKEYRQQRSIWLAIAILAVLLWAAVIAGVGWSNAPRGGASIAAILTAAFGMVSGALLLAGEKEERTLAFLDDLSGRRSVVWKNKFKAGFLFTAAQGLVLLVVVAVMGVIEAPETLFVVAVAGVDALIWGLLGGTLFSSVLTAVLAGIGFMALSWSVLIPFSEAPLLAILIKVGCDIAAVEASRRIFCRDDFSRALPGTTLAQTSGFHGVRVFAWLVYRQGRWVILAAGVWAILAGNLVAMAPKLDYSPLEFWPIGTLVLGLACGLAVFCPDQKDGHVFWGSQRFRTGRIWVAKVFAWAAMLIALTILCWTTAAGRTWAISYAKEGHLKGLGLLDFMCSPSSVLEDWLGTSAPQFPSLDVLQVFTLWPMYGFCFGLLFGQLMRRPVLALILSTFTTVLVVALWLPSLVIGGVSSWQWLVVPGLLLLTTWLAMRPWVSERLRTIGPMTEIAWALLLVGAPLTASLSQRAFEVPNLGEPFDLPAVATAMEIAKHGQAVSLMQNALDGYARHVAEVPAPSGLPRPWILQNGLPLVDDVLGMMEDWLLESKTHEHWMDRVFTEDWQRPLQEACDLPIDVNRLPLDYKYTDLAKILWIRSWQLQRRGDAAGAASQLARALAITRLMENYAPPLRYTQACALEQDLLTRTHGLLQDVGQNKAILKAISEVVQRHEALRPSPARTIEAWYLQERSRGFKYDGVSEARRDAFQAPWEMARRERIIRAMTQGAIKNIDSPTYNWRPVLQNTIVVDNSAERSTPFLKSHPDQLAYQVGLSMDGGISAFQWGEYILQSARDVSDEFWKVRIADARVRQSLGVLHTLVAIQRYRQESGKLPANLQELVPTYLAKIPLDPITHNQFSYDIEENDELAPPVCIASAMSFMGSANNVPSLQTLGTLVRRYFSSFENAALPGAPPGGAAAGPSSMAGFGAAPPMAEEGDATAGMGAPGGPVEFVPLPLLVPRAFIVDGQAIHYLPRLHKK